MSTPQSTYIVPIVGRALAFWSCGHVCVVGEVRSPSKGGPQVCLFCSNHAGERGCQYCWARQLKQKGGHST